MRLWHYQLLPYLPDAQFKGQLRELVAIMHEWRDKGTTNHLLINRVMEYNKTELSEYFFRYVDEYVMRNKKPLADKYYNEFVRFGCNDYNSKPVFVGWHNKEYLRVCMANLYEKHHFGIGKSRITDEEWKILLNGYKVITGEDYRI